MHWILVIIVNVTLLACQLLNSCDIDKTIKRNHNIKKAVNERTADSTIIEYIGMSQTCALDYDRVQTVVIYSSTDFTGNKVEHYSMVTANADCSIIYSWEDLDGNYINAFI